MRLLMPFLALALLSTLASDAAAQCPSGACAPAQATVRYSRVEYVQEAPAPIYVQSARTIQLYAPPPVPRTVYYYAAPAPAVYVAAPAPKRFPTPIRDFFFGR